MIPLLLLGCVPEVVPEPDPSGHGVALPLYASDARYDYGHLVEEIAQTGATEVLIAVPWSLPDVHSAALRTSVPRDRLRATLDQAREHGLSVTVMPLIVVQSRSPGQWRGQLRPDEPEAFWANYASLIRGMALEAEHAGAHRLVVGSELCDLEASETAWRDTISLARAHFSGRITYSANWDHYAQVPFWDALDEVGMTAYFPVDGEASARWRAALDRGEAFAARHHRPLLITEYGYPPLASAALRPWDETTGAPEDNALQAELYDTALASMACASVRGGFAWSWFGTGEAGTPEFAVRNRPAASVLSEHFQRGRPRPCPPAG